MNQRRKHDISRRKVLGTLGGVSALSATSNAFLADSAQAYDPGTDETRSRYRETDHVKAFYRSNGYETLKKRK